MITRLKLIIHWLMFMKSRLRDFFATLLHIKLKNSLIMPTIFYFTYLIVFFHFKIEV